MNRHRRRSAHRPPGHRHREPTHEERLRDEALEYLATGALLARTPQAGPVAALADDAWRRAREGGPEEAARLVRLVAEWCFGAEDAGPAEHGPQATRRDAGTVIRAVYELESERRCEDLAQVPTRWSDLPDAMRSAAERWPGHGAAWPRACAAPWRNVLGETITNRTEHRLRTLSDAHTETCGHVREMHRRIEAAGGPAGQGLADLVQWAEHAHATPQGIETVRVCTWMIAFGTDEDELRHRAVADTMHLATAVPIPAHPITLGRDPWTLALREACDARAGSASEGLFTGLVRSRAIVHQAAAAALRLKADAQGIDTRDWDGPDPDDVVYAARMHQGCRLVVQRGVDPVRDAYWSAAAVTALGTAWAHHDAAAVETSARIRAKTRATASARRALAVAGAQRLDDDPLASEEECLAAWRPVVRNVRAAAPRHGPHTYMASVRVQYLLKARIANRWSPKERREVVCLAKGLLAGADPEPHTAIGLTALLPRPADTPMRTELVRAAANAVAPDAEAIVETACQARAEGDPWLDLLAHAVATASCGEEEAQVADQMAQSAEEYEAHDEPRAGAEDLAEGERWERWIGEQAPRVAIGAALRRAWSKGRKARQDGDAEGLEQAFATEHEAWQAWARAAREGSSEDEAERVTKLARALAGPLLDRADAPDPETQRPPEPTCPVHPGPPRVLH